MASRKLGTLALYLTMNNEGLKKGAREAQGIVTGMSSGLKTLAGFFGVGLGVSGVVAALKSIYAALDDIGKGADRLSVTTDAYQELRYAARNTSADMSQVEMAVTKAGQAMEKAADGDKKMVAALRQLGLTWKDLAGLSPDKQLEMIGSALAGVEDEVQRNNAAIAIFGESGTKLMPFFNGLVDLRKEAQALGVVISEDTIRKAEATGDAFTRMGDKIMAMIADSGLVPWLDDVIGRMEKFFFKDMSSEPDPEIGTYTRRVVTDAVISRAKKSGKYSKWEMELMDMNANAYRGSQTEPFEPFGGGLQSAGYAVIDRAMSDAGFKNLQKRERRFTPYNGYDLMTSSGRWFGGMGFTDAAEGSPATGKQIKRLRNIEASDYASQFTTQAADLETATAELKKFISERLKRDLSEEDLKLLEPKIAELKKRFDVIAAIEAERKRVAAEAIEKRISSETLKTNQQNTLELMRQRDFSEEEIALQRKLFDLGVALNSLSKEQMESIANEVSVQVELNRAKEEQARLQKEQEQNKNFGEHMKDRFGSLRQMALKAGGYDAQAFAEQRMEEAATRKGAALTSAEGAGVARLAALEYRLTNLPAMEMIRSEATSNDLARRGGFQSLSQSISKGEDINRKILDYNRRMWEELRNINYGIKQAGDI